MQIIVFIIFLSFFLYGLLHEFTSHGDSYAHGLPKDSDSPRKLLRRITKLTQSELTSVKWRRCYITTVVIVIIVFFILGRLPTISEIILYIFTIFASMYFMTRMNAQMDTQPRVEAVEKCLEKLRKFI